MSTVTQEVTVGSWTPINMWAMLRALINNGTPILTNAGAPTSGASGTFAGQAGPGALLIDYTNKNLYINIGTLATPIWSAIAGGSAGLTLPLTPLTTNGAVNPNVSATYIITKGSALVDTIAAPTVGGPGTGSDGVNITITSSTAFAHTFTATGLFQTGGAAVNLATFNAFAGASLDIMAYNGKWIVIASNGVSFS